MPTYFARGVSVRLAAMALDDTATQKIILRKGDAAKQQSESAEKRLLESNLLKETVVPYPGDEDAFQLNWVANAPFMQTRVRNDVYDKEGTGATDAVSQHKSKALTLHVNLSEKTYVSGLYNQKTSIKVDVFFNGALSACLFIPTHDIKSGAKSNHQVFAGTRIDFLAERPWVILSPELAADGNVRKNNKSPSVEQRWQQLCQAIETEARERGIDEQGNKPPTAEFLSALATMQMPEQLRGMQKPGGKAFGIIDVVVTAGEGRKLTSGVGYLKAPRRMLDESYPFVLKSDGTTMRRRSDAPGKSESEAELQIAIEPSSEIIDVDVEGDSDPDHGSHTKRRALQSRVRPTRDVPLVLSSTPQQPILSSWMPSIPPPLQVESRTSVLQAPIIIGPDFASSPGFRRIYAEVLGNDRVYGQGADAMSRGGLTPKMMYPDLPPNLQSPRMRPSPYTVQFSDPTLGGTAPSDLMRQLPFNNVGSTSNPLDHFPVASQGQSYQSASFFPTPMLRIQQAPSRFSLCAYSPEQARGGFSNISYPRPNYNLSGVSSPLPGAPECYKPNMLPHIPPVSGHDGSWPPQVLFPPFDRRLSLPLPPTALYSVPTKPKRSLSAQKVSPSQQLKKAKSSIEVKCLVAYGQKDSILVDHGWDPAQRIDLSLNSPSGHRTQEAVAPCSKKHTNPVDKGRRITDIRETGKSPVRVDNPAPIYLSEHEKTPPPITADKQKPTNACQMYASTSQHTSTVEESSPTHKPEVVEKVKLYSDQPGTDTSNQNLRVTEERSSRCNTSSSSMLGVQGTKAHPFWVEDLDEILREASARVQRSQSSTKQGIASDAVMPTVQIPQVWETGTSSPLSSLHTTPEPEMEPVTHARSLEAPVQSSPVPIPQADGSPERKTLLEPRRSLQTPSPAKLASTPATPQFPRHDPSTPQSSATKKRKSLHRTLPKEPRSPTRLKTNDNPPLNRDCVIAYAESKDKKNKQGILRQVKSERQGVFTENYVIFAARFFVED